MRDPAVHRAVLERALATAQRLGLVPLDVARSPLLGPAGNREFFAYLRRAGPCGAGRRRADARPDLAARIAECTGP